MQRARSSASTVVDAAVKPTDVAVAYHRNTTTDGRHRQLVAGRVVISSRVENVNNQTTTGERRSRQAWRHARCRRRDRLHSIRGGYMTVHLS